MQHRLADTDSPIITNAVNEIERYHKAATEHFIANTYEKIKTGTIEYPSPDALWGFWVKHRNLSCIFKNWLILNSGCGSDTSIICCS